MAQLLTCTRSPATQILNQGEWDERLPRSFEITKEGLERAKQAPKPCYQKPAQVAVGEGAKIEAGT